MLNDASRRKFDVVMAWAIDRHLKAAGVDLYLDQQNIDTTTPISVRISYKVATWDVALHHVAVNQAGYSSPPADRAHDAHV